jgi:hypothetical protein
MKRHAGDHAMLAGVSLESLGPSPDDSVDAA